MTTSSLKVVWTNLPGCRLVAAEFWIGIERVWFTFLKDETDGKLKIEVLKPLSDEDSFLVDYAELQLLLDSAKAELLAMSVPVDD